MQQPKISVFFDYSLNRFVKANNNGSVHPGFTLPETQEEQWRRRELEKPCPVRQQKPVAVSTTVQENSQLQVETQQTQQQLEAPDVKILEGLTSEDIEALLEPWHPDQTTQD